MDRVGKALCMLSITGSGAADKPIGYVYFGGTTQDSPTKVLLMSKYKEDGTGRRIVARVDGSCALEVPPVDLVLPPADP